MRAGDLRIADWAVGIRKVDMFVVSRYRQAMRVGNVFPEILYDQKTKEVVSGNHRLTAYLAEYGEDHDVPAKPVRFKTHRQRLEMFARENATHGEPMDGFTKQKLGVALMLEGANAADVAALFGVPVHKVESWGGRTVIVNGAAKPVKASVDPDIVTKMTVEQYEEHDRKDRGNGFVQNVRQVTRHLKNGWVDWTDDGCVAALKELHKTLAVALQEHGE